jgi:hypothetical protein
MKRAFLLLITLGFFACQKEQDVTVQCGDEFNDITSADLLNAHYKPGTYWIYLDSITMTTDSTVIKTISEGKAGKCEEFKAYGMNMVSYPNFLNSNIAIYYTGIEKNTGGLPNTGIKIYTDFNYPDSSASFNCSRLDSVFIYDRYYKRVEKVTVASDAFNPGKTKSIYYFNSSFGLLRHDIFNSSNVLTNKKLLIRKNIIR